MCKAHRPNLSSVDLAGNYLDEVSMTYLVKTNWPELKWMDLTYDCLDDVAVTIFSHNSLRKLQYIYLCATSKLQIVVPVGCNKLLFSERCGRLSASLVLCCSVWYQYPEVSVQTEKKVHMEPCP